MPLLYGSPKIWANPPNPNGRNGLAATGPVINLGLWNSDAGKGPT
jgi:hypothetical protein